ncbi:MAG: tRNA (adenine-N1)-methyltransferase [Propionibacteriaceae bacterium]|jgi:tRNA (adenine57-N1/adenine58-N1)-methyltransferase|nr:tRNA (adenine-N1)-methyltransferase [Propionibacteriaceae bacterium]
MSGLLQAGERVSVIDPKGNKHSLVLESGKTFHTTKGGLAHDDIIAHSEGTVVRTTGGLEFLVFRPLLYQVMVGMPREAAVIYPKDAAQIIMWADIFPGATVLEAGAGSGALALTLLRAIGSAGRLYSYERRPEFAAVARRNVAEFMGEIPDYWTLTTGDLNEVVLDVSVDRVVLDMLAPWDCIATVGRVLTPGGVLCCYVTTTTQLGRVMDTLRAHGGFTEPNAIEPNLRDWHAEGLAIRPAHSSAGHTGFLVFSRRLAPGVQAPIRRRRPAAGAYGDDYHGPLPKNMRFPN